MSRQHIDLYRDDLRPREASPELARNLLLVGLAGLVMIAWGGVVQWRATTSATQLAELAAEQAALQAEITAASEQLAARKPDAALTAALVDAQFAVDGRRWLLERLAASGEEVVPFSLVLEGLGRGRPAPLWLTRIHVGAAGAELGLGGRTIDADAVPAFLQQLGAEGGFDDREFRFFRIDRPETPGDPLHFEMATACSALAAGCDAGAVEEDAP